MKAALSILEVRGKRKRKEGEKDRDRLRRNSLMKANPSIPSAKEKRKVEWIMLNRKLKTVLIETEEHTDCSAVPIFSPKQRRKSVDDRWVHFFFFFFSRLVGSKEKTSRFEDVSRHKEKDRTIKVGHRNVVWWQRIVDGLLWWEFQKQACCIWPENDDTTTQKRRTSIQEKARKTKQKVTLLTRRLLRIRLWRLPWPVVLSKFDARGEWSFQTTTKGTHALVSGRRRKNEKRQNGKKVKNYFEWLILKNSQGNFQRLSNADLTRMHQPKKTSHLAWRETSNKNMKIAERNERKLIVCYFAWIITVILVRKKNSQKISRSKKRGKTEIEEKEKREKN